MSDLLDWTVSPAPDREEILASPPTPPNGRTPSAPRSRAVSRRLWLIFGGVAIAALLVVGVATNWSQVRTQVEVKRVIAAEERAARVHLASDLSALSEQNDSSWLKAQTRWAKNGLAAPLPLQAFRSMAQAGRVQSISAFGPNLTQVDVIRTYVTPDGSRLDFALAQFYRSNGTEWKRMPPPEGYWGDERLRSGSLTDIHYFAVDEDFVALELGPTLDGVLSRACAIWACPPDFRLEVSLTDFYNHLPVPEELPEVLPTDPLLLDLLPPDPHDWTVDARRGVATLFLASPHEAGYPVDAAGLAILRRALATQALLHTAQQLVVRGRSSWPADENAFFYALVARMAARLGLDADYALKIDEVRTTLELDQLWDMRSLTGVSPTDAAPREAVRVALALLNRILQDQTVAAEVQLFRGLRTIYHGPSVWLSGASSLAHLDINAALSYTRRLRSSFGPGFEYALNCPSGPALYSADDGQLAYLFAGSAPEFYLDAWSPDGQYLTLITRDQRLSVVDATSGTVDEISTPFGYTVWGPSWVSDTILAYFMNSSDGAGDSSLYFLDVNNHSGYLDRVPNAMQYVVSPDGSRAAVVLTTSEAETLPRLAVMPALGGPLTYVGNGYSPSWSPDGKVLLYTYYYGGSRQSSLRMADLAALPRTYTAREGDTLWDIALALGLSVDELKWASELTSDAIRAGQVLTLPQPTRTILGPVDLQADSDNFNVQGVGSPSGEQIAFAAFGFTNTGVADHTWIGSINPADGSATVLFEQEQVWTGPPEFSADGRFLASQIFSPEGSQSQTIVVDTATHQVLPWEIPQFAWSPAGHRLIGISNSESLVLIDDPHNSRAEELLKTSCYNVLWRPAP